MADHSELTTRPRYGMRGENVAVLLVSTLLTGLIIGQAVGKRQGMIRQEVVLPDDAAAQAMSPHGGETHSAATPSPTMDSASMASDQEAAMKASAPPAPKSIEEARAMVGRMGDVPTDELVALGNRKFDHGIFYLAIGFYEKALDQQPDQPEVWCDLGAAFHALGQGDEALRCLAEALKRQPDLPTAWFNRGVVLQDKDEKGEAIAAYKKYLELAPDDPQAAAARKALTTLGG